MIRAIKYKNLISLIAVLILLVTITVTPCYAIGNHNLMRIKAGIAAAISALNITMNSTVMPIREMVEYVGDPFDFQYSYAEVWNDRPQIQIWDDYIEIDGTQYTDIWISHDAAEKFRVNAFDFQSAYNIASNSNGTFASGGGTYDGIPVYEVDDRLRTQNYQVINVPGYNEISEHFSETITAVNNTSNKWTTEAGGFAPETTIRNIENGGPSYADIYLQQRYADPTHQWKYNRKFNNGSETTLAYPAGSYFVSNPFDFDWVAGTIPVESQLPPDDGMMIRIPSFDPYGNKYLEPFLVDNPEFDEDQPVTVDVNLDPDIMTKLDDLFDIIVPIIPIINNNRGSVTFVENHEAPVPVPDVPIVDATVPQVVQPIINEIQNQGDIISQSIPPIIESIPKIDEICNNIDKAPYNDLDTGLDHLPSFFLPFITDLRSALGIWHYVTEWLAQISTTFAFITGCLVGTSIMNPIYAAIAGFMCIKIYRRMTA